MRDRRQELSDRLLAASKDVIARWTEADAQPARLAAAYEALLDVTAEIEGGGSQLRLAVGSLGDYLQVAAMLASDAMITVGERGRTPETAARVIETRDALAAMVKLIDKARQG